MRKNVIRMTICLFLLLLISCSISVDYTTLDFGSTEVTKELTLTIKGNVKWSISCDEGWVTVNPESGPLTKTIAPQSATITETTQKVNVTVNKANLAPGNYEATLTISNNLNLPCPDVLIKMTVLGGPILPVVEGYVYNADTNSLISGILVSIDLNSYTTNDSGYYIIEVAEPGVKTIIASKEGYEDYSEDIDVEDETVHDIYMVPIDNTTSTTKTTTPTTAPTTSTSTTIPTTSSTSSSSTSTTTTSIDPRFVDNGDGTVRDRETNLIWLKDANCFGQLNWSSAHSASLNLESGECGLDDDSDAGDWNLPRLDQWISFMCSEYTAPAVCNTEGTGQWSEGDPFLNVQSAYYWALLPAGVPNNHNIVNLYSGTTGGLPDASTLYVWPVKFVRFTDNGDGTVTDNQTGLVWLKDAFCADLNDNGNGLNWDDAMAEVGDLASGTGKCGLTDGSSAGDWRLPTKTEWDNFLCTQYTSPAVCNTTGNRKWTEGYPFNTVLSSFYWSGDVYTPSPDLRVLIYLTNGDEYHWHYMSKLIVWPVRDG